MNSYVRTKSKWHGLYLVNEIANIKNNVKCGYICAGNLIACIRGGVNHD